MIHIFPVPEDIYEALNGQRRHLFVKDSPKYATGDKALIEVQVTKDSPLVHREQLEFTVVSVDHGPVSKHVNGHYCLLGLYAPYAVENDIPDSVGGGPAGKQE